MTRQNSEKENPSMAKFMARQGDVLIVSAAVPRGATEKARDNGRVVLAYGEVTGHAHQIADPDAAGAVLLTVAESATFLRLAKKAQLVHEEHGVNGIWQVAHEVDGRVEWRTEKFDGIPAGEYQVIQQREWRYGQSIRVAD